MEEVKKYDIVFKNEKYRSIEHCMGINYIPRVMKLFKFKNVLDVGCGPGWSVVKFLELGKKAYGSEPCEYLHKNELKVLSRLGIVRNNKANDLKDFPSETFDLVFCTDVMEHIPEDEVEDSIRELVRVSKKYIYCTICSKEALFFPELKLHCTVRPPTWWSEKFDKYRLKRIKSNNDQEYIYKKM